MNCFIIATRNRHKVGEIQSILGLDNGFLALADLPGAPEAVEDAATFAGNATKKAVQLARWLSAHRTMLPASAREVHDWVLADDSGLEVDALNGAPGVHSARFAAADARTTGNSPDRDNTAKLLRLMKEIPRERRTARFHCMIALTPVLPPQPRNQSPVCDADEYEVQTTLFDGVCEGRIDFELRGAGGFGYDPLFVPIGFDQSFAQLGEEIKNRLSHRARALKKLKAWLERRTK